MIELFDHQKEALEQTRGFSSIGVYYDMGLGKTFIGSEAMKRYGCEWNIIICQKSKIQDWIDHFFKYYIDKDKFDESGAWCYDITSSSNMDMFMHSRYRYKIGVINYELAWRRPELLKISSYKAVTLLLDESSLIQNPKAKQTKFVLKINPTHVILLSGTPVGGKYENLWSQMHLLGWDISEDLYKKQYVNWTTIEAGGFVHKIVDKSEPYKNIDRLKSKMRSHGAVFKKTEECFDLPEQVFTRINVKSTKEYKEFMKKSIVEIEDAELVGDTSLTKMLYARQLCGQFNSNKFEAIEDLFESTQDKLVIFYNFNDELTKLKEICRKHERPTSEVNGHIKDLTNFKNYGNTVCLCQYQSASKGLNLQEYGCNKIIYFTLPLSSEDFEQSKKRIHRIGQDKTCFYYLMICKGSIEEDILQTLEQRKDFTDELFKEKNS